MPIARLVTSYAENAAIEARHAAANIGRRQPARVIEFIAEKKAAQAADCCFQAYSWPVELGAERTRAWRQQRSPHRDWFLSLPERSEADAGMVAQRRPVGSIPRVA